MTKLLIDLCIICAGYCFFLFAFPCLIHFAFTHWYLIIWLILGVPLHWRLEEAFVFL